MGRQGEHIDDDDDDDDDDDCSLVDAYVSVVT